MERQCVYGVTTTVDEGWPFWTKSGGRPDQYIIIQGQPHVVHWSMSRA